MVTPTLHQSPGEVAAPPAEPPPHPGGITLSLARTLGEILLTAGVFVLGFAAWQLWWTDHSATTAQHQLVEQWERSLPAPGEHPALHLTGRSADIATGQVLGVVRVPRWGADYARPVIQGTAAAQLRQGIGHEPSSALPGQVGNFSTAGHRVTYGKPYAEIDTLRPGDAVVVESAPGWSVYRYQRWQVVSPRDTQVFAPVPGQPGAAPSQAWMTMIACHPRFSATQRYAGFALLEGFYPRTSALVPEPVAAVLHQPPAGGG